MCGVVGRWRQDGGPADADEIAQMLVPIAHRGPDDSGIWCHGHVGLGHCRLSIIDLSTAGHQPMLTGDGTGVLSYNGEVYNFGELRRSLELEGVTFRSTSDAEVLLAALHRWGPERTIPLLNGMFAFAYFDRRTADLWLARDRLGIKQLYIHETAREICFASEVKALTAVARLGLRIDTGAVQRRFLGAPSATATLYEGIVGLTPGTWWKITSGGTEKCRYFDIETALDVGRLAAAQRRDGRAAEIAAVRTLLSRSVKLHLASDAPLAAMCSGGVDSSLIAAYAHDALPGVVGYVADAPVGSGEGNQAEAAGRHIGIPIRRIPIERPDYLRLWALAVRHLDGPSYHPSEPALLAVAKACRADGIKVLLTGEGADELFGGYPVHAASYRRWRRRDILARLTGRKTPEAWATLPIHSQAIGGSFESGMRRAIAVDPDRYLAAGRLFDRLEGIGSRAERAFLVNGFVDIGGHLAWLLHRHDHMGMAASIEMRVPFIENQLIDLALHLPFRAKRHRGQGKWVEKIVANERLPRHIVFAKKKGFPMPGYYTKGTEQMLVGGYLADLLGWSNATTKAVVDSLGHAVELRFDAVGLEIWLQQSRGGKSADTVGEMLNALAA